MIMQYIMKLMNHIHQLFPTVLKMMGLKSFCKICQNFKLDHVKWDQIDIILYEHLNSRALASVLFFGTI